LNLADALTRLYARIVHVPGGMRLGLDAMRAACEACHYPEGRFLAVHVAGTNGKGSVCAMVEAIARAQGKRTGLYTSPHLCRFAERIRIDGEILSDDALAHYLGRALDASQDLTFFETATLAAFLAFRDEKVEVGVVEVGLGGRLDATNVLPHPRAAAITRIAMDHTDRLGTTLVEIAREKAGIAKVGMDLVLGEMPPHVRAAIDDVALSVGATTSTAEDVRLPGRVALEGDHQQQNARIAVRLAHRIGASTGAVEEGLAGVRWPGRLERIGDVLLDAAHNPDGADALARYVRKLAIPPDRVALVFGTLADKDWPAMLASLAPLAATRVYVAPSAASRPAVDPSEAASRHPGTPASSFEEALAIARSGSPPSLTVVAGSLVLVGRARAHLLGLPMDPPVAL
jgi:dihydrofolate synthase/folylpolyglutamate synthase